MTEADQRPSVYVFVAGAIAAVLILFILPAISLAIGLSDQHTCNAATCPVEASKWLVAHSAMRLSLCLVLFCSNYKMVCWTMFVLQLLWTCAWFVVAITAVMPRMQWGTDTTTTNTLMVVNMTWDVILIGIGVVFAYGLAYADSARVHDCSSQGSGSSSQYKISILPALLPPTALIKSEGNAQKYQQMMSSPDGPPPRCPADPADRDPIAAIEATPAQMQLPPPAAPDEMKQQQPLHEEAVLVDVCPSPEPTAAALPLPSSEAQAASGSKSDREAAERAKLVEELKGSQAHGLTDEDATARLDKYGRNEITEHTQHPLIKFLLFFWERCRMTYTFRLV